MGGLTMSNWLTQHYLDALTFAAKFAEGYGFSQMQHGEDWTGAGLAEALQMLRELYR